MRAQPQRRSHPAWSGRLRGLIRVVMAGTILLAPGSVPLEGQWLSVRTGAGLLFSGQEGAAWMGEVGVGIAAARRVHLGLGVHGNIFPMLGAHGEIGVGDRDPLALALRLGAAQSIKYATVIIGGRAYLNTEVRPFHVWAGIDWFTNDFFDGQSPMLSLGLGLRWPDG